VAGRIVFDIEADNLLVEVTRVHCISTYDIDNGEAKHFTDIPEALRYMDTAELLIGHNICQYDVNALRKLYKWEPRCPLYDTLLAGNVLYPEKTLSLETWAKQLDLDVEKVANEDWSVYTEHMGTRCQADVLINVEVFKHLKQNKHEEMIEEALEIEQQIALMHGQQMLNGVHFDREGAAELLSELNEDLQSVGQSISQGVKGSILIPGVPLCRQEEERADRFEMLLTGSLPKYSKHLKADGTYNVATIKYFEGEHKKVQGPYSKIECKPFDINNSQSLKDLMLSLGWKPTEWNWNTTGPTWVKTSPKLTEDSYDSLPSGLGKSIAHYNTMKHRRNFLLSANGGGVLRAIRSDGRVTADAFTCGTPTGRYRHKGAVCNIPRITTAYGREIRALYGVAEGCFQVGVDLSGIEIRMLGHYLLEYNLRDAQKTVDLILSPDKTNDFHSYNAKVWGCDRDTAKTTLYALLYGAGAKKLAGTLGIAEHLGATIKEDFYTAHPGIKQLMDLLEIAYKQTGGYVKGLDGRPLYVRKVTALLNTLLQNAGAVVFKQWGIDTDRARPPHVKQMIAYHDEFQWECEGTLQDAEEWKNLVVSLSLETGRRMNLKIPIASEGKVGKHWADCH